MESRAGTFGTVPVVAIALNGGKFPIQHSRSTGVGGWGWDLGTRLPPVCFANEIKIQD
jgi:hypothetical protein